ncbi:hypothetical protein GFS31_32900 [Leptolyngbya sp. BL0902]|nr:hypothetical protein GFS31_32900 [Leptolyngbya sp. BL0902]
MGNGGSNVHSISNSVGQGVSKRRSRPVLGEKTTFVSLANLLGQLSCRLVDGDN